MRRLLMKLLGMAHYIPTGDYYAYIYGYQAITSPTDD